MAEMRKGDRAAAFFCLPRFGDLSAATRFTGWAVGFASHQTREEGCAAQRKSIRLALIQAIAALAAGVPRNS
ncbi:hypothetical protein DFP91_1057 [Pseudorhodoplanes sinuspersici]|nr:hypothetical protein DFP91_1057 [Pseudorhodoplanes sinuspersici]